MKYHSTISCIGAAALQFLSEETPFLILFDEKVPPELAEIAVLHRDGRLLDDVAAGDTLLLGEQVYEVTAVGDSVSKTLGELGHCTLCFKNAPIPERPGCLMLAGPVPIASELTAGTVLEIH